MTIAEESLALHYEKRGKIEVIQTVPVSNARDLSLAYTPGVAQPCLEIQKDVNKSYELTRRWNMCLVVTDGTAVLGLGDIGPEAGMPVMEGKCVLFKAFGGVDAFPLCIKSKDVDEIVRTIQLISGSFGGVNLEDISAPRCFEIERRLKECCDIPIFHDDQHGTAIIMLAGLTNALKVVGKKKEEVRVVINGAGALVTGVTFLIIATSMSHGVWAVLLSIAILFVVMLLIKRHYESVRAELRVNDTDVETRLRKSPTAKVILPIGNMDRAFLKALNYALSFAQAEIELYHVIRPQEDQDAFRRHVASWNVPVSLVLEATEFRNYNQMVLRHVEHEVKKLPPGQMLTVILPQLNVRHWWQFVLHNQTSAQLSHWLGKNRSVSIIIIPFQI